MHTSSLGDMFRGWFVGNFSPVAYKTEAVEVAVKEYKRGDVEGKHLHKVATEITLIYKGRVEMNGVQYGDGQIIVLGPGEVTDFRSLTDSITVVVKIPAVANDKYSVSENA